jgi:hypothetical protein
LSRIENGIPGALLSASGIFYFIWKWFQKIALSAIFQKMFSALSARSSEAGEKKISVQL